ncbi:hypothetical protein TNCV_2207441 [Trichonephila clavipes]|uniref:Uncharacterized protein n=1 Tax=Trichonephila clavipes TaxID=2585209 RepID=A0A8X6SE19_TRICX|nr:hypothetical protein TNCV_2207441 [Trichonephila clavipes]
MSDIIVNVRNLECSPEETKPTGNRSEGTAADLLDRWKREGADGQSDWRYSEDESKTTEYKRGTLNSRRADNPLVRLMEEEERWEAPDNSQCVLPLNFKFRQNRAKSDCYLSRQIQQRCSYSHRERLVAFASRVRVLVPQKTVRASDFRPEGLVHDRFNSVVVIVTERDFVAFASRVRVLVPQKTVRASDFRPEGLGSMPEATQNPPSTRGDGVQKPRSVSLDVRKSSIKASLSRGNRKKSGGLRSGESMVDIQFAPPPILLGTV